MFSQHREEQIGRSASIQKILKLYQNSKDFHSKYIQAFAPDMSIEDFHKYRLSYLNLMTEELGEYFDNNQKIQMLINTLQITFCVWNELQGNAEQKRQLFIYFFFAACFLVMKIQSPALIKIFKSVVCERRVNLNYIFRAEKIILNRTSWDMYLATSNEIQKLIINEIFENEVTRAETNEYVSLWVHFSLNEYFIYKNYDELTIVVACLLVALSHKGVETGKAKLKELLVQLNVPLNEIEHCAQDISELLIRQTQQQSREEKDIEIENETQIHTEEIEELELETRITRANSDTSSFQDILFNQLEGKADIKKDLDLLKDTQERGKENQPLLQNTPTLNYEEKLISVGSAFQINCNKDKKFLRRKREHYQKFSKISPKRKKTKICIKTQMRSGELCLLIDEI